MSAGNVRIQAHPEAAGSPMLLSKMNREGPQHACIDPWKSRSQIGKRMGHEGGCEARACGIQETSVGSDHGEGIVVNAAELHATRLYAIALPARPHGGVRCACPWHVGGRYVSCTHRQAISHVSRNLDTMEPGSLVLVAVISGRYYEKDVVLPRQLVEFARPAVWLHSLLYSLLWTQAEVHDLVCRRWRESP